MNGSVPFFPSNTFSMTLLPNKQNFARHFLGGEISVL